MQEAGKLKGYLFITAAAALWGMIGPFARLAFSEGVLPIGAVCLFPLVEFSHKTPTAWAALICIAFFSTYGAYYCYYIGLKHMEASRASITATLEPVVAAVVAYFWWGETFSLLGYIGSALILGAVILMVLDGLRQ